MKRRDYTTTMINTFVLTNNFCTLLGLIAIISLVIYYIIKCAEDKLIDTLLVALAVIICYQMGYIIGKIIF